MKREIYTQLVEWKSRRDHKPLVVDGARQVGKTHIIKEFGDKEYVNYGILNPENPNGVCNEIEDKLGIPCMIVDACDLSVAVLGKSHSLSLEDTTLAEIVRDNPAGQGDECTPIILIRPVKGEQ